MQRVISKHIFWITHNSNIFIWISFQTMRCHLNRSLQQSTCHNITWNYITFTVSFCLDVSINWRVPLTLKILLKTYFSPAINYIRSPVRLLGYTYINVSKHNRKGFAIFHYIVFLSVFMQIIHSYYVSLIGTGAIIICTRASEVTKSGVGNKRSVTNPHSDAQWNAKGVHDSWNETCSFQMHVKLNFRQCCRRKYL